MEHDRNDFHSQPEFLSFERRLLEVVHELNMKRRLLEECRLNLESVIGKQHELERMLDAERRDSQKMRMQLQVAAEAVQQCGEQRAAASPELSRLRIELELTVRERDCLKNQTHACQLENLTLRRQVAELQGQLHCQQIFQETNINLETKIRTAVEEVKSEIQELDQDHRRLETTCEMAEKMASSLQEAHARFHSMLKKTVEQQKKYESEVVVLRAEVMRLKMEKSVTPLNVYSESDNESETCKYLLELKEFVAAESKGSTELNNALQKALQAQSTFQKLEQEVREKLQEELERVSVLQSSNSFLNKSLCEAHDTVRSLEQQVQEMLAKPASEELGTQTDTVAFVCEERGTQTDVDICLPDVDSRVITKSELVLPKMSNTETTNDEKECEILPDITDN